MAESSTTFNWAVNNLERETADGFVFTAHYTVTAADGTYTSGAYGSVAFDRPDTLIPFSDLTEELVISWVKDRINNVEGLASAEQVEEALQSQLNEQHVPTKAGGVPWAS